MYFLSPRNRYVLVEPVQQDKKKEEEQRAFFIPTEQQQEEAYKVVRVIEDSNSKYEPESLVLVPTHLLEKIEISGQINYLITENYIIATVTKLED
jgi:type III secretory pathway component EscR